MEIIPKAGRPYFKLWLSVIIIFFAASIISFRLNNVTRESEKPQYPSISRKIKYLDLGLEDKLVKEVRHAVSGFNEDSWPSIYARLERVRQRCREGNCDPEVFFNDQLDFLADELTEDHFIQAGVTLGIIYGGNWKLEDLDGDGSNEVIVLQRDALNVSYTLLKVFNFYKEVRRSDYKMFLGYFSSPNSSGGGTLPIDVKDLDSDGLSEVLTYVSSGRGGADLYVFKYQDSSRLDLIYKKDDVDYPKYTFTDVGKDGSADIVIEGFRGGIKVRESITL
ncbi:MAG: hypothetical protein AAB486_00550 [Patescibacteria group bacterium]